MKYLKGISIDPFARNCRLANYTNDINPNTSAKEHLEARVFLRNLELNHIVADTILFDPPYSPRQIYEHYQEAGLKTNQQDTQNSALYADCRRLFKKLTKVGSVVLSFGWNSAGMGKGWEIEEIMLVSHGSAHNDTICVASRKINECQMSLNL